MKYIINRVSTYDSKPCDNAEEVKLEKIRDIRFFINRKEWIVKFPEATGVTKEGYPFRIIPTNSSIWVIEIENIIEFVKQYGSVIVERPDEKYIGYEDLYRITIYDDYIE